MSLGFFIVGFIIFVVYVGLLVWSIFYNSRKQKEENYPSFQIHSESMDYDGMGDFSRFPVNTRGVKKKKK